jgi:hypothetical protein
MVSDQILKAAAATHLATLGEHVCELMTNVTTAMHALPPTTSEVVAQVVRYEDLAAPYTAASFRAVIQFLGIRGLFSDGLVDEKLMQVIGKAHADFKISGWAYRTAQVEAVAALEVVQPSMAGARCSSLSISQPPPPPPLATLHGRGTVHSWLDRNLHSRMP